MTQRRRSTLLEEAATSVLASQDVPTGFVEAQLNMATSIAGVARLEVEGFVLSDVHHSTVFPQLQTMLFSKEWKSVHFVDALSHNQFEEWQAAKDALMRQVEMHQDFSPIEWCNGRLAWNATITIPANVELRHTMKLIKKDLDIFDVCVTNTREAVIVEVSSGWSARTTVATDLLRSYLSNSTRQVGKKQLMSDRSASSLSMSASSLSSWASASSQQSANRRQRKRGKRVSAGQVEGSPDYNWKVGVYTAATVSEQ